MNVSGSTGAENNWEMVNRPMIGFPESLHEDFPKLPISSLWPEQLIRIPMKPQAVNHPGSLLSSANDCTNNGTPLQRAINLTQATPDWNTQAPVTEHMSTQAVNCSQFHRIQPNATDPDSLNLNLQENLQPQILSKTQAPHSSEMIKPTIAISPERLHKFTSGGQYGEENLAAMPINPIFINEPMHPENNELQSNSWFMRSQLDANSFRSSQIEAANINALLPHLDNTEWKSNPSACQSFAGCIRSPASDGINPILPSAGQELCHHQMNNSESLTKENEFQTSCQQDLCKPHSLFSTCDLKNISEESNSHSDLYSCLNFDTSNGGSTVAGPSVSGTAIEEFCSFEDVNFPNPSAYLVGNFCSPQDMTSASLAESQAFSLQEFPVSSGGASSSNGEFDDSNLLKNNSWQQVTPRVRTYTKVGIPVDLDWLIYNDQVICYFFMVVGSSIS